MEGHQQSWGRDFRSGIMWWGLWVGIKVHLAKVVPEKGNREQITDPKKEAKS